MIEAMPEETMQMQLANSDTRRRAGGFTIIELMVVLAIVAAVLVLVPPGMAQLALTTNLKSYSHEMLSSLYLTRSEAIKRNVPVTLCVSTDGSTCAGSGSWAEGWIIRAPDGTVIKRQQAIPDGFSMSGSGSGTDTIVFQPSGAASTSTDITVCRQTPVVGNQERVVRVAPTGRARVITTRTGTCA